MQLGADHVRVRVPATSANLGPGFDALGLALPWYDEIEIRALASTDVIIDVRGEGAGVVPDDETHLVIRALRVALDFAGAPQMGFHLTATNTIPHSRGLGSSAAAVVAGIVAARGLIADPRVLDDEAVLGLATEFEGHPDNAAPAILGGLTIAWMAARLGRGGNARAVRLDAHRDLEVLALVPAIEVATRRARGVLPASVAHGDAAFNAGRAALLVHALTRSPHLLFDATEDRLHQDYRAAVMASSAEVVRTLRGDGFAAVISGAGPSVLVLSTADQRVTLHAAVGELLADSTWSVRPMGVAAHGASLRRIGVAAIG